MTEQLSNSPESTQKETLKNATEKVITKNPEGAENIELLALMIEAFGRPIPEDASELIELAA